MDFFFSVFILPAPRTWHSFTPQASWGTGEQRGVAGVKVGKFNLNLISYKHTVQIHIINDPAAIKYLFIYLYSFCFYLFIYLN